MDERDRLNETNASKAVPESEKADLKGKEFYGVGEKPAEANAAWEGREPFPKDLGGINHPGDEDRGGGLDPLTGDRGSAQADAAQPDLPGVQLGDEAVGQAGGATGATQAQAHPVNTDHYAEGGFEARGPASDASDHDRSLWEKARDEVKSWTGDRDAEARRRADHAKEAAEMTPGGDWKGHDDDTGWRDPVSPGKEAETDKGSQPTKTSEAREHRPGVFRE